MKEKKLRAWDKKKKQMFQVVAIDWEESGQFATDSQNVRHLLSDIDLMEYVNIKDKTAKEIYEEDIIKSGNGALGIVKWRYFSFEEDMINTLGWWLIQEDGEIIGNTYENPELLN